MSTESIKSKLLMNEEDARGLAAEAAPIVADAFRVQGWTFKGVDGEPCEPDFGAVADVIMDALLTAAKPHSWFLPELQRDKIKVTLTPNLRVAEVWLLAGSLQWPEESDKI